jgi:hypothetical protein
MSDRAVVALVTGLVLCTALVVGGWCFRSYALFIANAHCYQPQIPAAWIQ